MKITKFKDRHTRRMKWKADFTCAGERYRISADTTDELYDEIDAIKRRARAARYGFQLEPEIITLAELVKERKKDFNDHLPSHIRHKKTLDRFAEFIGDQRAVHTITTADVRAFVHELRRLNPTIKPITINGYLNFINACLRKAADMFPALESWKPPRLPFEPRSQRGRERIITEEEIARLFFELRAPAGLTGGRHPRRELPREVKARQTVADIFEIALLTGMRQTEVRTLTKHKIDWTIREFGEHVIYGFIQLPPRTTKTREPRRIPLNFDARQILERRAREAQSKWLFPNEKETAPIHISTVSILLRRIATRIGLVFGRDIEDGFIFHDTRHTAATRMLETGAHIKTVGEILGHSDKTMTMRYSHARAETLASAVSALSRSRTKAEDATSVDKIPADENHES